jgi:hypothetical protein
LIFARKAGIPELSLYRLARAGFYFRFLFLVERGVIVVVTVVVTVLVIVQVVANDAHFFRQRFFDYSGLSLTSGDAAHVRRIHPQSFSHAVIDAPKK